MKKIATSISLLLIGLTVLSQEHTKPAGGDTTRFKIGQTTLIFVDNNANGEIEFECETDSSDKKEETAGMFVDFGMNGYMAPDYQLPLPSGLELMEVDYTRSWSFGFAIMMVNGADIIKDRLYISPGIGLNWTGYSFRDNINISPSNEFTDFTVDSLKEFDKYKLKATYLQIPLILGGRIGNIEKHPLGLQAGIIGGLKIGSRIKQKYTLEDASYKARIQDDFNLNPFRLEAIARISIADVGLFARYSFTPLFEKNKGPEVYPFAIGITLGEFTGNGSKD